MPYSITATHPVTLATKVLELKQKPVFERSRTGEEYLIGFVHKLTTQLNFYSDSFDWLKAIDDDPVAKCLKIAVVVSHGSTTIIEGYLSLAGAEWDLARCKVTAETETEDENTCWRDTLKEKKNVLVSTTPYALKVYQGTLETHDVQDNYPNPPGGFFQYPSPLIDPGATVDDYAVLRWELVRIDFGGIGDRVTVTYGTYRDGTNYDRPFTVVDTENTDTSFAPENDDFNYVEAYNVAFETGQIDNARKLEDVLDRFVDPCGLTVQSNFFGWGANQSDSPANDAYAFASNYLQDLFFFQKSDIIRAEVSNNATSASLTLEEILKNLFSVYKVLAFVEGTNFRLEHISHFYQSNTITLNMTVPPHQRSTQGKRVYRGKKATNPRYFKFSYMDGQSDNFTTEDFVFAAACTDNSEKNITANLCNCDINWLSGNDNASNDGFSIVATELVGSDYVILKGTNPGGTTVLLNFPHSWQHLEILHRYELPLADYTQDGVSKSALSVAPSKEEEISCGGVSPQQWAVLDPTELVRTNIGDGRITSIEYNDPVVRATLEQS